MNEERDAAANMSPPQVIAAVSAFLDALVKATGDKEMPMQRLRLFLALYKHRELMQINLEDHTGMSKASNSRLAESITARRGGPGWAEMAETDENRKYNVLNITTAGKQLLEGVARKVARHFAPRI